MNPSTKGVLGRQELPLSDITVIMAIISQDDLTPAAHVRFVSVVLATTAVVVVAVVVILLLFFLVSAVGVLVVVASVDVLPACIFFELR